MVAKGFTQQEGDDFIDTYSPVAKLVAIKVLLTLTAQRSWPLMQLDVNNALLNGDLDEKVYMDISMGYLTKRRNNLSLNLYTNYINQYMAYNKHPDNGIPNFLPLF